MLCYDMISYYNILYDYVCFKFVNKEIVIKNQVTI